MHGLNPLTFPYDFISDNDSFFLQVRHTAQGSFGTPLGDFTSWLTPVNASNMAQGAELTLLGSPGPDCNGFDSTVTIMFYCGAGLVRPESIWIKK